MKTSKTIAVFFSKGAFGDCARHSILHMLENPTVERVKVFSTSPGMLEESDWKCGCGIDHGEKLRSSPHKDKVEVIPVTSLTSSFEKVTREVNLDGVDAVIAGLGNRQIFLGDRVAKKGIHNIVQIMKNSNVNRIVMMSSMGLDSNLGNDRPGIEWRKEGKFMDMLFKSICRREYNDLVGAENELGSSDLSFLSVRAVGLGENVKPKGEYFIQKQKHEDVLCPNMAKMDAGKFLLDQVIDPTYEKIAVVLGGDPRDSMISFE